MNRQEALRALQEKIPSFRRDFLDKDFFGNEGWMVLNDDNMPKPLPADYLLGIKVSRDGKEYTVTSVTDGVFRNEAPTLPEGRRVSFSYFTYSGNEHLYGNLHVDGVELSYKDENGESFFSLPSSEDVEKNRLLLNARYRWKLELGRIIDSREMDAAKKGEWDYYRPGDRTQRFFDFRELLYTAVYVCLKYINGPFFLTSGGGYHDLLNVLVKVDKNEDVTFTSYYEDLVRNYVG